MLIVLPTAVLMASLGDSLHSFVTSVQSNTLPIPAPGKRVVWPLVGKQLHATWSQAHADLPGVIHNLVAQGVLGLAPFIIQAIVVALVFMIADVPFPGTLAAIVLVLGIAQVPALLVTLPAIAYLRTGGDHGTGAAVRLHRAACRRRHAWTTC